MKSAGVGYRKLTNTTHTFIDIQLRDLGEARRTRTGQADWKVYCSGREGWESSWPWPVLRLKRAKFRFVFCSKKAQISLYIRENIQIYPVPPHGN